jgi:hypothetical protein
MDGWIEIEIHIDIISLVILINFITQQYKCISLLYWIGLCIEIMLLLFYVDNYFMFVTVLRLCICTVIL